MSEKNQDLELTPDKISQQLAQVFVAENLPTPPGQDPQIYHHDNQARIAQLTAQALQNNPQLVIEQITELSDKYNQAALRAVRQMHSSPAIDPDRQQSQKHAKTAINLTQTSIACNQAVHHLQEALLNK